MSGFDLDSFVVSWAIELNPATRPITDFQFFVERSTAEEGPFDVLNPTSPLVDVYTFTDTQVNRLSKWREFYYRIRAVDLTGGDPVTTFSNVESMRVQNRTVQQLVRLEITRTERILLDGNGIFPGFVTVKCLLFNRRTFGQRCPECWDSTKKVVSSSQCVRCFSTGFLGGYHKPIPLNIAFGQTTERQDPTPLGVSQENIEEAWTSSYPSISPDDLLIDVENLRWRVLTRRTTENTRIAVRQILQIYQLDPGDIEYLVSFDPNLLAA